jgi:hypothetical protein
MMRINATAAAVAALLSILPAPVAAQLASPSTPALGMGDNYTAAARGYSTMSWNPALLGLSGNPTTSATVGTLRLTAGLGPVTIADLAEYQGEVLPENVKQQWLARIRQDGGQRGGAGFDVTWVAVQSGRFGLQVSTSGRALNDIGPGLAELMLSGNADSLGNARALDLGGGRLDNHVYSTGALSFGMPVTRFGEASLAVGATAKFTIGHLMARGDESSGGTSVNPAGLQFSFPIVYSPPENDRGTAQLRAGGGFGLDVGVALESGIWSVALAVHNAFSAFEWDQDQLRYRPLELHFTRDSTGSSFEWRPLADAPADVRERTADQTFLPSFSVGAAVRPSERLLVTADARTGSSRGMATRAPVHVGAGAEYRPLRWLPLQLGASYLRFSDDRDGLQLGGGLGLEGGSFALYAAAARRSFGLGTENVLMVTVLSHVF